MNAIDRRATTLFCLLLTSSSYAATLTEYQLSAAAQPTDIDATYASDVYFLDPGTQTINRLSGGTLTQWPSPCALSPTDKIAVSTAFIPPVTVYFTDIAQSRLCFLDVMNSVFLWANLPFFVGSPRTLSVSPSGIAWYSSTPAAGIPAIGAYDPSTSMVKLWMLPSGVAVPGDAIDGLAFFNILNLVYFTVAGSQSTICVMNPVPTPSPTQCYPVPVNAPAPLRVNSLGDAYRVAGFGNPQIFRLKPFINVLTAWNTPNPPDVFLSPVDPPYFTSLTQQVDKLDPTIPGVDTSVPPGLFNIYPDSVFTDGNAVAVAPMNSTPTVTSVPFNPMPVGAFTVWSNNSSSGPLSIDSAGSVWISETSASRIATF